MREDQLVLHFETLPNRYPDTTIAARALLDWVDLVQKAVAAVAPAEMLTIEIVGVREGSSRFPQLLRWLNDQSGNFSAAWDEYPHLKKMVAGSAHTFWTSLVAAGVSVAMQPGEQVIRLPEDQMQRLEGMQAKVAADPQVQSASKRFYRTVESDPAIVGVGVANSWHERPALIIPRSEFAERSGLWVIDEDQDQRMQRDIWDVVLLRPNLVSRPQPWQFMRDGLKFSAQMADAQFLVALRDGRIPLTLQEGVVMRVEVEYVEKLDGQVWTTDGRSRKIVRVLSPSPRPQTPTEEPRKR